jgi:hypothetical protein
VPGRRRAKSSYPGPPGRRAGAVPPVRMARDPPEHRLPCLPDSTTGADVPKIRPHPSVSTDGEHAPAIPSTYSLRFVSYPSPSSPVALPIRCIRSTFVFVRSSCPSQVGG